MRVFGIAGFKNSGKTTLMVELVREFAARGMRIATLKHAHHEFDIDQPGKDSYQHRAAGAVEVIVASSRRWAHICELQDRAEPSLGELVGHLGAVDLVLAEGYKHEDIPKLELRRGTPDTPVLAESDASICAIVADTPMPDAPVRVIDRGDLDAITECILEHARDTGG